MMINRIRRFTAESETERRLGMVIESQNELITKFRWNLFVAKRNARVWFWLWMATVAVHVVSLFI